MTRILYFGCDFLYTAIKVWATWQLMETFARPRWGKKKQNIIWSVMILMLAGLNTYNDSVISTLFSNGCMTVIIICLSFACGAAFYCRYRDVFCMVFLLWTGLALFDFFFQTVACIVLMDSGLAADIFLTATIYRGVYLLLCAVSLYMVVRLVRNQVKGVDVSRYLKWGWFLVPLFCVCEIYFQRVYKLLITERVIQRWWLFLMGSLLAALFLGAYVIIQKERENGRLLKLKMDMLEGDYAELLRVYEEKEILRHDIKTHMRVIREMAEEGHDQEILCYLDEMDSVFQKGRNRNLANHDLINLIINQKFREAEGAGISLRYELEDMSGLVLKPIEICALFSNMLDNAIEANSRITEGMERWIEMTCARRGQMLILHTVNPVMGTGMRFSEGLPETTKGDKRNHGFGMRSIRQVVNTYEGHMQIENKGGVFELTVYLKGF